MLMVAVGKIRALCQNFGYFVPCRVSRQLWADIPISRPKFYYYKSQWSFIYCVMWKIEAVIIYKCVN